MKNKQIFHDSFIMQTIQACNKLCKDDVQVFKPALIAELGLDVDSQEASGMISLMFQLELVKDGVNDFKLVKGKNGGIKRITAESKKPKVKKETSTSDRKCTKCGKIGTGHNARTCTEEAVVEEQIINETDGIVPAPENNNSEWLVENEEVLDNAAEG